MGRAVIGILSLNLVLPWMLCLGVCMSDLLGIEWEVLSGSRCEDVAVSVRCNSPEHKIILRSVIYNISCVTNEHPCEFCKEVTMDKTKDRAPFCNLKETCSLPALDCPTCYRIISALHYACVPTSHFFSMCPSRRTIHEKWGIIHSNMFPAYITTEQCYIALNVPSNHKATVKSLYIDTKYPTRIDVCGWNGEKQNCSPPGETEHRNNVYIYVTDALTPDSTRFILQFAIYRDNPSTPHPSHFTTATEDSESLTTPFTTPLSTNVQDIFSKIEYTTTTTTVSMLSTNDTATSTRNPIINSSSGENAEGIVTADKEESTSDDGSLFITQDYVIIGLAVFLAVVVISAATICVVVYRRSTDSALRRVVVVLVSGPTKRLSRLSQLFRNSNGNHPNRYSNPPGDNSINRNGNGISVRPVVIEESAENVLSRLRELGAQTDEISSASGRYKNIMAPNVPMRQKRALRTSEVVIETPPQDYEQGEAIYSIANKSLVIKSGINRPTDTMQSESSDEPVYEFIARPVLPSIKQTGHQRTPHLVIGETSHQVPSPSVYNLQGNFADDDLTIVENDGYADVEET